MVKVSILSCPAYSIVKQARLLYLVLKDYINVELLIGTFFSNQLGDIAIILGNPHLYERNLYNYIKDNKKDVQFIFYIVLEGNIIPSFIPMIQYLNDGIIITPSNYAKAKLEQAGFKVEKVIPHGVEVYGYAKASNTKGLGYISGYMERKYPNYLFPHIGKFKDNFYVITNNINPYKQYFNVVSTNEYNLDDSFIYSFYKRLSFYLNISDSEGFGLTPLEALAFGNPVIAPRYEPLTEFLPNFTLWVNTKNEKRYENWGNWLHIEHNIIDVDDLLKKVEIALNMSDNEYKELSYKSLEYSYKYDVTNVYVNFLEFLKG